MIPDFTASGLAPKAGAICAAIDPRFSDYAILDIASGKDGLVEEPGVTLRGAPEQVKGEAPDDECPMRNDLSAANLALTIRPPRSPAEVTGLIAQAGPQEVRSAIQMCRSRLAGASLTAALFSLAAIAFEAGDAEAALDCLEHVENRGMDWFSAAGAAAYAAGRYELAEQHSRHILSSDPRSTTALKIIIATALLREDSPAAGRRVAALLDSRDVDAACIGLSKSVYLALGRPFPMATVHRIAGACLVNAGRGADALALLEHLPLDGGDVEAVRLLALAYFQAGDSDGAEAVLQDAPDHPELMNLRGVVYMDTGRPKAAVTAYRRAAAGSADPVTPLANAAMAMHYDPQITSEDLRSAIAAAASKIPAFKPKDTPGAHQAAAILRDDAAPVRLGVLSAHFHTHPAALFSVPAFEALDRRRFEIHAFSDGDRRDAMTERMRRCAASWTDCRALDDAALAERIRARPVDMLIDLSGYAGGRVGVIARRPASVQIKWVGGLFNTSGLAAFDWLVSDAVQSPAEEDDGYSEQVYRLPGDYVVFEPPASAPEPGPAPCIVNKAVTFGSLNSAAKVNAEIVALWAEIMRASPGSRIILKARGFASSTARRRVRSWFEAGGVAPDRIEFAGWTSRTDHLSSYCGVDLVLDTWPYSGGLTTCEALWMGCPVVTLKGATIAGRHGATHLTAAGLQDWIADTPFRYVAIANALAADFNRLCELRAALRGRLRGSRLCDVARFARDLEAALVFFRRSSFSE